MKTSVLITNLILGLLTSVGGFVLGRGLGMLPLKVPLLLLQIIAAVLGFAFGFWVIPFLYRKFVRWFVNLVTVTVQVTVARTMGSLLATQNRRAAERRLKNEEKKKGRNNDLATRYVRSVPPVILDTSAIIDGRFLEVSRAGYFPALLILPKFVIEELQRLADSEDDLRRQKGRRGLDLLDLIRKDKKVKIQIWTDPVEGETVDGKITVLAGILKASVATVDYNLNKSLTVLNIPVLNVNDLTNLVKTVILPGETLKLRVIQKGKEAKQGVGYLPDGTMIVVENGEGLVGKECLVKVWRLLQTPAGKMIFARPLEKE